MMHTFYDDGTHESGLYSKFRVLLWNEAECLKTLCSFLMIMVWLCGIAFEKLLAEGFWPAIT